MRRLSALAVRVWISVGVLIILPASAAPIEAVENGFALVIDTPLDGSTSGRPDVLVRGSVVNATGNEIGVTVNGVSALLYENGFAANHVPLKKGENLLIVALTDTAGHQSRQVSRVYADPGGNPVRITADPESGIAPLDSILSVELPSGAAVTRVSVQGPAGAAAVLDQNDGQIRVRLNQAGIFFFTVEAELKNGRPVADTTAMMAVEPAELDRLIKNKWRAMVKALTAGDIDGSLAYYSDEMRNAYREIFAGLKNQLPRIVENMKDIKLIWAESGFAKFRITGHDPEREQRSSFSYDVYFTNTEGGIWKLYRY